MGSVRMGNDALGHFEDEDGLLLEGRLQSALF